MDAGKKGGRPAKALKTNKTGQRQAESPAKAGPKQPEPELELDKKPPSGAKKISPSPAKSPPKKNVNRGCRLASDWAISPEWEDWAVSKGLSRGEVREQAECFKSYWLSKAGKDAVKLDWFQTWQNWIRKQISWKRERGQRRPQSEEAARSRRHVLRVLRDYGEQRPERQEGLL